MNKIPEIPSKIMNESKDIIGTNVRINIRVDNTNRGISFTAEKEPDNHEEWIALLEELIRSMKAPSISDPDVLGEYSP